jgi:hypothetical protein
MKTFKEFIIESFLAIQNSIFNELDPIMKKQNHDLHTILLSKLVESEGENIRKIAHLVEIGRITLEKAVNIVKHMWDKQKENHENI